MRRNFISAVPRRCAAFFKISRSMRRRSFSRRRRAFSVAKSSHNCEFELGLKCALGTFLRRRLRAFSKRCSKTDMRGACRFGERHFADVDKPPRIAKDGPQEMLAIGP